jgi:hypothetical protein
MFDLDVILSAENDFLLTALIYVSAYFDFKSSPPDYFCVDEQEHPFSEEWLEEYAKTCQQGAWLVWGDDNRKRFEYQQGGGLILQLPDFAQTPEQVIERLQVYPWLTAVFLTHDPIEHRRPLLQDDLYNLPRTLRWGMAFKGKGHQSLPSRRYLAYGPWRILRYEPQDITLIQFHDVNADIPTVLEQAKPGHEFIGFMGEHMRTVMITQNEWDYGEDEIDTLLAYYSPSEKMLRYTVNDHSLSRRELLEACKARVWQPFGKNQPIERIAYVFTNEEDAWENLHELWLREIECWTIIDRKQVRIDEDYTPPPPQKPDWVRQLEAQDNHAAT